MATIRVYDGGKKFQDRYTLYFPHPNKIASKTGIKGHYCGFNVVNDTLYRYGYGELKMGNDVRCLGKKINIAQFPQIIQEWIKREESEFNENLKMLKSSFAKQTSFS